MDPAEEARRAAYARALAAAREALASGRTEEAVSLAKEAAALPGADGAAAIVLAAAETRRAEALAGDVKRLQARISAPVEEEDPVARAAVLEGLAAEGFSFAEAHPDADGLAALTAAARHAKDEAARHRTFVDAMNRGYAAVEAGKTEEALEAARQAFDALPRAEARDLRERAVAKGAPEGMVYVPEGPGIIGRARTAVRVKGFYMDRTEVTCAAYARFLLATRHAPPPGWVGASPPAGRLNHPVVNVTGDDAEAFALWAGKRLPTDYEWEKAARGPEGRDYPWGDRWDGTRCHVGKGGTVAAGSTAGDLSAWGLADMGGNVSEITVPVKPFPPPALPDPPGLEPKWAAKGGHWGGTLKPESLALFLSVRVRRGELGETVGFRCVKDLPK